MIGRVNTVSTTKFTRQLISKQNTYSSRYAVKVQIYIYNRYFIHIFISLETTCTRLTVRPSKVEIHQYYKAIGSM